MPPDYSPTGYYIAFETKIIFKIICYYVNFFLKPCGHIYSEFASPGDNKSELYSFLN